MDDKKKYCRNCSSPLTGPYCSECGQKDREIHIPVKDLASEIVEIIPSFDERLIRTLRPFLFSPGALTQEYLDGKRKQYVSPFKLYFFISFFYFLIASFNDSPGNMVNINTTVSDKTKDSVMVDMPRDRTPSQNDLVNVDLNDSLTVSYPFWKSVLIALDRMKKDPSLMLQKFTEYRPKIIFILMPVFAFLLKLLYVRSSHLYIKHLVFSFYVHSFVFLILLVIDIIEFIPFSGAGETAALLYLVIPAHLYYGLKRVYKQSTRKTFVKMVILTGSYLTIFLVSILLTLFAIIYIYY